MILREIARLLSYHLLYVINCVSFEVMRTLEITTVFTFDPHFKEQGFRVIP